MMMVVVVVVVMGHSIIYLHPLPLPPSPFKEGAKFSGHTIFFGSRPGGVQLKKWNDQMVVVLVVVVVVMMMVMMIV